VGLEDEMAENMTALEIENLTDPGLHYTGSDYLYVQVKGPKWRSWIFRYTMGGRTQYLGLGSLRKVPLSDARRKARECARSVGNGVNPLESKRGDRQRRELDEAKRVTFREAGDRYIAAHRDTWRSEKHRNQWDATLGTYVFPVLGDLPVQAIDVGLVLKILEPIWAVKSETANRVRGRIETVLDWAKARGYRDGENPARWRGHLSNLLPKRSKVRAVVHHPALPYAEIGRFMGELRTRGGIAASALEFTILTAARTGEVLGARWDEIDLEQRLWTIPAQRMKAAREHRIPLSAPAAALLERLQSVREGDLIFPGARSGQPLSNMAMIVVLRRMSRPDLTVHGFRSTFRDWASECTRFEREAVEMALAHAVGSKVETAYRRGDLFDKRRRLMDAWAQFCSKESAASTVVPLRAAK
jgi:integrase